MTAGTDSSTTSLSPSAAGRYYATRRLRPLARWTYRPAVSPRWPAPATFLAYHRADPQILTRASILTPIPRATRPATATWREFDGCSSNPFAQTLPAAVLGTYVFIEESLRLVGREGARIGAAIAADSAARPGTEVLSWKAAPKPLYVIADFKALPTTATVRRRRAAWRSGGWDGRLPNACRCSARSRIQSSPCPPPGGSRSPSPKSSRCCVSTGSRSKPWIALAMSASTWSG